MLYIKTLEQASIVQPIFGSGSGDEVRITLQRLSDDKYYNFSTYEFQADSIYGTMTLQGTDFWKAVFTPPQDDTYLVKIEDVDLPFLSRGQYDSDYDCIVAHEYTSTQYFQVYVSVAGGVLDTGWTPATKVSICNFALRTLKLKTITADDLENDTNESARILNDIYEPVLKEVLVEHPWNFAVKRVALKQLEETPAYGFTYVYELPEGCLRVIETEDDTDYQIENTKLLSDESSLNIRYIAYETDPSKYTSNFVSIFALKLAVGMAYSLTGNENLAMSLKKDYIWELAKAKSLDGQESPPEKQDERKWVDDRS